MVADTSNQAEWHSPNEAKAWAVLGQVMDPEVPAVSLRDLGLVRSVSAQGDHLTVVLTPTYSGCPATEQIHADALGALQKAGFSQVHIEWQRAPAWTTDWMTPEGREKLRAYGIAPPGPVKAPTTQRMIFVRDHASGALPSAPSDQPACPRCGSHHTETLAAFGSTACKSLHRCLSCLEPFDHFKPI